VKWAGGAVVLALAAVVAVNVLLLAYGGDRHDPVGRLSPVTHLPAPTGKPRPLPPPAPTGGHATGSDD
jgi:hypothetical protein